MYITGSLTLGRQTRMSFLWGPEEMGCFNSGRKLRTRAQNLQPSLGAGENVFSGKKRPSDLVLSQVWATLWQWEMPARPPARPAHQRGPGTVQQVGFHRRAAHTWARGGRSREENPEKMTHRFHRSCRGWGARLPSVPESPPGLDALPPLRPGPAPSRRWVRTAPSRPGLC